MIEFNLRKTKIQLDFSFFAVLAFCFFLDRNNILFMSFAACVLHETGHLITMLLFRIDIRTLCFYGAGVRLGACLNNTAFGKRIAVLLAGSSANLLTCALTLCLGFNLFAAVNLMIGIFNLLSIGDFDGKQIITAVTEQFDFPCAIPKVSTVISCIIVISISLYYTDSIGITFYLTLLYMLLIR